MRFLIRLIPPRGGRAPFLRSVRSLASSVMLEVRNPKWTSYGALEVDVFTRSREDFGLFLATLEPLARLEFSRDLNEAPPHKSRPDQVAEARGCFNSERYWEAHEVLEGIWRNIGGEEKLLVQGLILLCAALVHHQKGEDQVALGVLRRASKQLSYSQATYYGIDIGKTAREAEDMIESKQFRPIGI